VPELSSRRRTTRLGRQLAKLIAPGDLLVLSGPLGAGKTFLVRALCRGLGLPEAVPVTSPTFALVQDYDTSPRLVHADLYRLGSGDEVLELGLDAARREGNLLVVEWGAPFLAELGGDGLFVELGVEPRNAAFRASGPRSEALLDALRAAKT
jgi:tRNA threonylcarbamoyl adenosine modification protein YjeE